jgi:hypothetical protein
VKVPLATESIAVLEFLGFTSATGRELWEGFIRPKTNSTPLELMDYVYEHISLLQTPIFQEMAITKALILIGLDRSFMQTLFNPTYSLFLKSNHSLHAWVRCALGAGTREFLGFIKTLKGRALWLRTWRDT